MQVQDNAEGVTRFRLEHKAEPLSRRAGDHLPELIGWRHVLRDLGLIGEDPGRYDGAAFGILSCRLGRGFEPPGRRSFVITGTQTSGLVAVSAEDFAIVDRCMSDANLVVSHGPAPPSSEAMTHSALYDIDAGVGAVFHAHSPSLWSHARELDLPTTRPEIEYGTPEMASEVARLFRLGDLRGTGLLVMAGHLDGVISFGRDSDEAGTTLVRALAGSLRPST